MNDMQVLFSKVFSDASARLNKDIRSKVIKAINNFTSNPRAYGLHQEKLQTKDIDIYSMRVDDNYRIIYKRPNMEDLIVLLYVDQHDKAYKWAETHTCAISAAGAIQIYEAPEAAVRTDGTGTRISLLSKITDEQFRHVHIPQQYWEPLRTKVFFKRHLVGFKDILPEETYYFLEQVLNGFSIEVALEEYDDLMEEPEIAIPVAKAFFADYASEDLLILGVPDEYLTQVKSIKTMNELVSIQNKLPEDCVQYLYSLLNGEDIKSLITKAGRGNTPVDDDDFGTASGNPGSGTSVVPVMSAEELEELMNMPMEKWRVFLHPEQRFMINRTFNGPARILGGAGTGKTVIIVHRARYLASHCGPDEKVLVTTFSKTLAEDISKRLSKICTKEELDKITIMNVDAVARDILTKNTKLSIRYPGYNTYYKKDIIEDAWMQAMNNAGIMTYEIDFLEKEWQDIIQAQNITDLNGYLNASRAGRGKQLGASARTEVWSILEKYREYMTAKKWVDIDWAENMCTDICKENPNLCIYKSILIDECQDLRAPGYRMLRALAGPQHQDDLYFAGDSRQKIYSGKASLSQCGINVVGRSTQLKMNYRTTCEIYDAAYAIQRDFQYDDLDGQNNNGDRSICIMHGEKPQLKYFNTFETQMEGVIENIRKRQRMGFTLEEMCIVARRYQTVVKALSALKNAGIPTLMLANSQPDDKSIPGVRCATMHRVKGMEFECMYIIELNKEIIPPADEIAKAEGDEQTVNEILKREANLISVSMTRAKKFAWLSYSGQPSKLLASMNG